VGFAVNHLRYLEFAVAGQVLSRKLMFRIIEDEIKIHQLDSALAECLIERQRLEAISKTCRDLGFKEAFVAGRVRNTLEHILDLSAEPISIPIDGDRVLVLHDMPRDGRPLPMDRLISVIRTHLEQIPVPSDAEPMVLTCELAPREIAMSQETVA
jgi:hypothetical protein